MNSLLLIIELPEAPSKTSRQNKEIEWMKFLETLPSSSKQVARIERIAPNTWLIPAADGLPFLCSLVAQANCQQYPCRVLVSEGELNWIGGVPEKQPDNK
jgi:hypothetical protein